RALVNAQSLAGLVPAPHATAVVEVLRAELYDVAALAAEGRDPGNPVEPLVRAIRARAGDAHAEYVHRGATSQDILHRAAMLAALGDSGPEVLRLYAIELDLREPVLPWHTRRGPLAELAAALDVAAVAAAKIARDIVLLAQTEVGEVTEGDRGASSTMPHKHNPVQAVLADACARHARASAALLVESGVHEHERAV